ncbi:uncharacterized protein LOC122004668 [Zingiber officinale]|uniref:uncharacterized protein LOC122004668 n=1 Tax=Zingiber officinale TaxID=94328 RepID=UPI001C4B9F28|nr:uncharacterized protein LOC122004668 [Zingiber officinale]
MDIPTISSETMMHAFTQGLIDRDFFHSLIRKPPRDYDNILKKASEYINVEEAQTARKKEASSEPLSSAERRSMVSHQPPRGPRAEGTRSHQETRPHAVQHVAVDRPKQKEKVWTPMFCSLHQSATHNTRDCRSLGLIAHPPPRSYRRRSPSPDRCHRHQSTGRRVTRESPERQHHHQPRVNPGVSQERMKPSAREEENRSNTARGRDQKSHARQLRIHEVGCSQERAQGPKISFGPIDLEGVEVSYDDALIIQAKTFDQLQINGAELLPMTTPLYGFTSNEVLPVGQTRLAISLGEELLQRTRTTNFIVVDAPSAYNVILGRPTLNKFRAVVLTFCQKIKFPVEDKVGEVR